MKLKDEVQKIQEKENLRELLQSPAPRRLTIFESDGSTESPPSPIRWEAETVAGFDPESFKTPQVRRKAEIPPPTPPRRKFNENKTDEIIDCAMELMDLCMHQNRYIRKLEEEFNNNK